MRWLVDWARRRGWFGPDTAIDALIAAKGAKPIAGMEAVDWRRADRAGQVRWHEVLRGQRRQYRPEPDAPKVTRLVR